MTVGTRLKYLRSQKEMTQDELGKAIGVQQGTIRKYEYDEIDIPKSKLEALSSIFNVSVDFLIGKTNWKNSRDEYHAEKNLNVVGMSFGFDNDNAFVWINYTDGTLEICYDTVGPEIAKRKGKELITYLEQLKNDNIGSFKTKKMTAFEKTLTKLPLYNTPVSAGTGQWLADGHEYEYEDFEDVPNGADFALRVRGDSMEPMYSDGDIVFVRANIIVEPGQVGVFCLNDEGYLKIWQGNRLVSLNTAYKPIIIGEYDSFFICGRVIGKTEQ